MNVSFRYSLDVRRVLFFWGVLLIAGLPSSVAAEGELSEEALADLIKPGVVRIAEHVTGTAQIPAVKVDIRQRLVAVIPDRFTEVTIDEYLSGSGFVIHPDGYIATNAHVVSLETIKTGLASESALSAIFENALMLSDEEMQEFLDDTDGENFSKRIVRYIIDNATFDLRHEVAVLRPGASGASMGELLRSGFPAEIVSQNERFFDDERDVAILKIGETGLPALSLGSDQDFAIGKKVFIFGFPATAEINEKNPSEATFTRGIVSAIKQSSDGKLRIFQTDAKVSQGSSGGPLFDERGEVIGMVTFQTDELARSSGDNFAFALPIDVMKDQAFEARILPEEGVYGQSFRRGFAAFLEKRCDIALSAFDEAEQTHPAFSAGRFLESYRLKCRVWQEGGQSRDTYWDEVRGGVSALGSPVLYIVGGGILSFGLLGLMVLWLFRQLHREEREITALERRLQADEQALRRYARGAAPPVHTRPPGFPPKKKV